MANIADFSAKADQVQDQDFQPIPDGWYRVEVKKAELKATKDGNGQYINVQYGVLGPSHAGRIVFDIINVRNASAEAERIGLAQLKRLKLAIGLPSLTDTDQLVGRNLEIDVKTQKSAEYGDKNVVKSYRSPEGSAMPTAAVSTSSAPPWAKK
jgi:hypothetical protein